MAAISEIHSFQLLGRALTGSDIFVPRIGNHDGAPYSIEHSVGGTFLHYFLPPGLNSLWSLDDRARAFGLRSRSR